LVEIDAAILAVRCSRIIGTIIVWKHDVITKPQVNNIATPPDKDQATPTATAGNMHQYFVKFVDAYASQHFSRPSEVK